MGGDDDGGDGDGVGLQHLGDDLPLAGLGVGGSDDDEVGPGGLSGQDGVPGGGEEAGDTAGGVLAGEVVPPGDTVGKNSPHLVTVHLDQVVLDLHLAREGDDGEVAVDWQLLSDELVSSLSEPGPGVRVCHVGRGLQSQDVLPDGFSGDPHLGPGVCRLANNSLGEVRVRPDDVQGGPALAEDGVLGGDEWDGGVAVGGVTLQLETVTERAGEARGPGEVGNKETGSSEVRLHSWQTFLSIPEPGPCQGTIVCYCGKNISILSVVTRIESVITESRLVKYTVTVFGPEVDEGPGLPPGDVGGGEEGVRDGDEVPGAGAAPALLGVGVVAVVHVTVGHQDVPGPAGGRDV